MTEPSGLLDAKQLRRIEAVHRGFLYQHLYASACLLEASRLGILEVIVERDEDIELRTAEQRTYIQVKTRSSLLDRTDVAGVLNRFDEIRAEHRHGRRLGSAVFRIISNVPPSPSLEADIASTEWPTDVQLLWPGCDSVAGEALPPPWSNLSEALRYCVGAAATVPFSSIAPETLVWKLAARVQFAATGDDQDRPAHAFDAGDLPALFEQFVQQLQDFPLVPADYRPQVGEPPLETDARTRLIVAFSGAGKTAWSSHVAQHCAAPTAYFDAGDLPGAAVAGALARELAARFLGGRAGGIGAAGIPAGSGLDMLRAIDRHIDPDVAAPIVVVDNVHRVPSADIRAIVDACRSVRFVFLAQPWLAQTELELLLEVQSETLAGWNTDTIAAEFAEHGCHIDAGTAERWRIDTGGLPMYVRNVANLTAAYYQGDAARLAAEVEAQVHATATAQEIILGRVTEGLPTDAKTALSLLSLSTSPLARGEAEELLAVALSKSGPPIGRSLRELAACGALQMSQDGRVKVHDVMRPIGRTLQADLPPDYLSEGQRTLRDLLLRSFQDNHDLARFGVWLRLLALTGQVETLVDIATQEYFHESGDPSDLRAVLESAAESDEQTVEARFWTLDALAFWDWQSGDRAIGFQQRFAKMAALVATGGLGDRERAALGMKRMLVASMDGDLAKIEEAFRETERECSNSPMLMRMLRYNRAVALFHAGSFEAAQLEAQHLYLEYYDVLGLDPLVVIGASPSVISAAIGGVEEHQDDLKHLADCLDLYAIALGKEGGYAGLARLHAMKFYAMSGAYRSAVRTGQDAVDDLLAVQRDPEGARMLMENHLLPMMRDYGLTAKEVGVRGQYAVVLAYCGEAAAARTEMQNLLSFAGALPELERDELLGQISLVEAINAGRVAKPQPISHLPLTSHSVGRNKVGRNQLCPCGSGEKFKRCHGQ